MNRMDKAERIRGILEDLYPRTPVPLDHTDPFTLLVAVLLSAQTTDKKVNEVTPELFAEGPTPAAMAALGVERIKHLIRQIGLTNTKAKNVARLSEILRDAHGSVVPADFEALEALPGVGHKTASVVMAQAFGVPAFPVDTHIHRLAARWGLSDGKNVEKTERDLKAVYPAEHWNRLHLQIIFFGREHCPALYHDLSACPICGWASTKKRQQEELAIQQARRRTPSSRAKAKKGA
jgi:endonuclease III